jgi:hypothetical protein
MKTEALKNIFKFLEDEGEHKAPFMWKLENNIPFSKEELEVDGDLDLYGSKIKSLPEGLKVGGHLSLFHSKNIESLPEGLQVGRDLYLGFSQITSLPEGLNVGRNLYLDYTTIDALPKGLKVDGDLSITNNPLAKLSDDDILSMIEPDGYITGEIIRG